MPNDPREPVRWQRPTDPDYEFDWDGYTLPKGRPTPRAPQNTPATEESGERGVELPGLGPAHAIGRLLPFRRPLAAPTRSFRLARIKSLFPAVSPQLTLLVLATLVLACVVGGHASYALGAVLLYNPTARAVFALLGWYPVKLYGTSYDNVALTAAISAAGSAGLVVLSAGTCSLGANVTVTAGVNVRGAGGGVGAGNGATVLQCTTTGAGLKILGDGGVSGDFTVDGNATATAPVVRGDNTAGSGRVFMDLHVKGSATAGDNLLIQYSQNDSWYNLNLFGSARDNLVLDAGCGGHFFFNPQIGGHGRYGVNGRASVASPGTGYIGPEQIRFYCGRVETGSSTSGCAVQIDDGNRWSFNGTDLGHSAVPTSGALVNIKATSGRICYDIAFRDTYIFGPSGAYSGLHVDSGCEASWEGGSFSISGGTAFDLAAGALLEMVRVPYSGISYSAGTPVSAKLAVLPPGAVDGAWAAPTLLNSWANIGAGFSTAGYRKDGQGFVHLKGVIASGTTAAGTNLFTLPVGYRPAEKLIFGVQNSSAFGWVYIANTGNVTIQGGSNGSLQLDGITFLAAA